MNQNKVAIIILNWNGWEDTLECLESLYQISYQNYHVIVVDNGSEDDSIERIKNFCSKTQFESKINVDGIKLLEYEEKDFDSISSIKEENIDKELTLLKNTQNYGYARGNNIGIRFAIEVFNPDYILLLNNDTTVDENFLTELLKATTNQQEVGIYAPKILKAENHKIIDSTGHVFSWGNIIDRGHGKVDKHQFDPKSKIVGAKGAAALYKSEMLQYIGLFKEDYITSYEDAELSWRANKNSWKAQYVPKSIIYHKGERSIKKDDSKLLYFKNLSLNNITLTVKEHGNRRQKILFTFLLIKFVIGSYIVRLMGMQNFRLNYLDALKKLYE